MESVWFVGGLYGTHRSICLTIMHLGSLSAWAVTWLAGQALAIDLTVSKTGGNASSPLLYGIMFEVSDDSLPGAPATY